MIEVIIPIQAHERIRDRVGEILLQEFNNQVLQFYNTDCDGVTFYAERTIPIDKSETDIICLSVWKGDYSNRDVDYVDGTYRIVIDAITNSAKRGGIPGDRLAAFRVQKLVGIVRYILESSQYKTLGFDRPFILHTELTNFQMQKYETEGDGVSTCSGQAIFTVRCGETTAAIDAPLVAGHTTSVKLGITDFGLQYIWGDGSEPLPPDPRYVYIKDQFGNVLEMLPGGSSYTVEVLEAIIQSLNNPPPTVIQTLS